MASRLQERTGKVDKRFVARTTASGAVVLTLKRDKWEDVGATARAAGGDEAGVSAPASSGSGGAASATTGSGAGAGAGGGADESKAAGDSEGAFRRSTLSVDERFALCRSVGEECIEDTELRALLAVKDHPICYDGFEPSGRMHIAQGILKSINVNRLTQSGCVFKFWVADWFAMLNHKMGGDLKKIRKVGEYMIEVWRATGMDMENVRFLWASDHINGRSDEYWSRVMDISTKFNLARIKRCATIMGRKEEDDMSASQIMYPAMQCADVFFLKADICQLGMDQRKVNMLAREYCDKAKIRFKPIILSHHMLMGLKEGQEKMSKSDPDSAIFMEDTAADVKKKINRAFCPEGVAEANPVLDWCKHIVFARDGQIQIRRKEENGGDKLYTSFEALEADFVSRALHPGDLKAAMIAALNAMLQPVRDHFATGKPKELLKQIKKFQVTR